MSDTPSYPSGLSSNPGSTEGAVPQLSVLWRQGQEPDLKELLAGAGRLNAAELTDVLCTDQRQRWLNGQRPEVEAYIALHRSLHPGAESAIDLVFGEFMARRDLGESPTLDEYCRRFQTLAEQLRLHVRFYDALDEVGLARCDSNFGPRETPAITSNAAQTDAIATGRHEAGTPRGAEAGAFESENEGAAAEGEEQRAEFGEHWEAGLSPDSRFTAILFSELPGYEILGEAGRGGMGIVYKARQLRLQRLVAIKVVLFGGDTQTAARFHQEFLLARRLVHPNLVAAYDAGAVSGLPYMVMEFVEGIGLDALVRKRGPLLAAEACEVVRQAALGLQHLYENGLVHRDIKPSNLMLTPAGQVKLLDLGLARLAHESSQVGRITSSGQFLGTLDYMAPEQCDNSHAVDVRADIYSLGCTLYHLLAGGPPFAGFPSPYQKLRAHVEIPMPPLSERGVEVPERLTAALLRMLAKNRNDRFARPADVIAAVHPFTSGADLPALLPANLASALPECPARLGPPLWRRVLASRPLLDGVIPSLSGALVNIEGSAVDATLLTIEEIISAARLGDGRSRHLSETASPTDY